MKQIIFAILFTSITLAGLSQKLISEATLKYNITIKKNGDKTNNPTPNATYQLLIKGNQTKSDFVNSIGTETSIYNSKTEKGVILKEYSGQKLMINLTKQDWLTQNQLFRNIDFKFEDLEKNIGGTKCKVATASLQNGGKLTVYYDTTISVLNNYYTIAFPAIPGLPIQFENNNNGVNYIYTLTGINYEVLSPNVFDIPKSGYRVVSYQEAISLKKGE
jgi:hypothetical protein